jgi:hypothetical protein
MQRLFHRGEAYFSGDKQCLVFRARIFTFQKWMLKSRAWLGITVKRFFFCPGSDKIFAAGKGFLFLGP